ncbi:MAG: hypothetical protein EAZ09_16740 [Oscillatoriales cyanobacterium]|nr:MAG: hypothetical protein EAZ18_10535 [Oscillatoriales cyanobacterium]TAH19180.1 MAG: hypothetical protein EAZ09_16740 [Oscillatoriales cyanobacterium]
MYRFKTIKGRRKKEEGRRKKEEGRRPFDGVYAERSRRAQEPLQEEGRAMLYLIFWVILNELFLVTGKMPVPQ